MLSVVGRKNFHNSIFTNIYCKKNSTKNINWSRGEGFYSAGFSSSSSFIHIMDAGRLCAEKRSNRFSTNRQLELGLPLMRCLLTMGLAKEAFDKKLSLRTFITKWAKCFNCKEGSFEHEILRSTIFSKSGITWAPDERWGSKENLIHIFFFNIKEFPVIGADETLDYTLLRGRVKDADYIELWKMLYDMCDGCPGPKEILIEDIFSIWRIYSPRQEGDQFFWFYSGRWLYSEVTWRRMLGNPLLTDWNIASTAREEMDIVKHVLCQALASEYDVFRIFGTKRFFDYRWEGYAFINFPFEQGIEVWAALYNYFLPGSAARDVLLELVLASPETGAWYSWWTEDMMPFFKWNMRALDEAFVNSLSPWFQHRITKWRKKKRARLESEAAFKLLNLVLTRDEIHNLFQTIYYNNDFHKARLAWQSDFSAEDKICRAFLARFTPLHIHWIFNQLTTIFPAKECSAAAHKKFVDQVIKRNLKSWKVAEDRMVEEVIKEVTIASDVDTTYKVIWGGVAGVTLLIVATRPVLISAPVVVLASLLYYLMRPFRVEGGKSPTRDEIVWYNIRVCAGLAISVILFITTFYYF